MIFFWLEYGLENVVYRVTAFSVNLNVLKCMKLSFASGTNNGDQQNYKPQF